MQPLKSGQVNKNGRTLATLSRDEAKIFRKMSQINDFIAFQPAKTIDRDMSAEYQLTTV